MSHLQTLVSLTALSHFAVSQSHADTGEASLRPQLEVRYGAIARPNTRTGQTTLDDPAFSYGGGLLLGLGLDFNWTATLRYGFDTTGEVLRDAPGQVEVQDAWTTNRHAVLAGISWAHSDQFTPLLLIEAGVAFTQLSEISDRRGGQRAIGQTLPDQQRTSPAARLTAGYEWRLSDFWSVTAATHAEYAEGLGVGVGIWLGGYHYTQWF